jgi:phosphatidylinositol 3,5-bisphosphate 5-phosphatase
LGDIISLQYGGSNAHKQNIGDKTSSKRFEFITSFKRHYNNNFSDQNRQYQIDLFLGNHIPNKASVFIWETTNPITLFPDTHFLKPYQYGKE